MENYRANPEQFVLENFEEQFKKKDIVEIDGKKIGVVDIKPQTPKTDVPVFICPGWAENSSVFKKNILTMAELGRETFFIDSAHGINIKETKENTDNFPEAELRKVEAFIKVLEEKNIDKIDAVAHSEGGIYLIIAAILYPEKFRNLVLVDPAGIIGKDSFIGLAKRFSADLINETKRGIKEPNIIGPIIKKTYEAAKAIIANPKRSMDEVFAIAKTQTEDLLKELKEKGIGISIIHAVDDKAFPIDNVQENITKDDVNGFYSVKGTHNEIILNPEKYTKLVDFALTAMEEKDAKNSN
ncbi:MAG: alpha/beta fold hydrolase [bacterium]